MIPIESFRNLDDFDLVYPMTPLELDLSTEDYEAEVDLLQASFLPEELVVDQGGCSGLPDSLTVTLSSEGQDPIQLVIDSAAREQSSAYHIQLRVTSRGKTLGAAQQARLTDSCAQWLSSQEQEVREQNPLFNIAMYLRERVQEELEANPSASSEAAPNGDPLAESSHQRQRSGPSNVPSASDAAPPQPTTTLKIKRVLLWSHHLLAISKRKDIVSWSSELSLAGLSKPGYPGVIVVEGEESDADEFVRRIKALQWQALQVRCEESEEVPEGQDVKKAMRLHLEQDAKPVVHEVESLAQVSSRMSAAGLDAMFASALKLPGRA